MTAAAFSVLMLGVMWMVATPTTAYLLRRHRRTSAVKAPAERSAAIRARSVAGVS